MPALRAHVVFLEEVWPALRTVLPGLAATIDTFWPAAVLGALAPDVWYIAGGNRRDLHGLDKDDPGTWDGAIERWLAAHPGLAPVRRLAPEAAAFVGGYLVHLGLDTWAQYQEAALPRDVREVAPIAWFPPSLAIGARRQAVLRALAEKPFPKPRVPATDDLARVALPPDFPAEAIKALGSRMLPALVVDDPWATSRIHPWRAMPDTAEAHREWLQHRAALPPATPAEYADLFSAAGDFTLAALRIWWDG